MISFEYNRKKMFLWMLFSILIILLFSYDFINAEDLTSKRPESYSKYSYVGHFFYKSPNLLRFFCGFIVLLFLYFFVSLIRKIIKGNVFYENRNGFLICDDVKIVKISDIKNFDVKKINRNIYIRIHLKDSKKFIEEETNFLKKLNFHIVNYSEKTPFIMSVDFFQEKPDVILEEFKKLVFNSELK